ncbi:MAG: hypothetical protein U0031_15820 [Thermomicrobiales bacterium]
MRDRQFDAFVRSFGASGNRRQIIAVVVGGLFALQRVTTEAAQPGPASCAAEGDVCTLLYGCCEGLTCATSAINPSYGVCVPGSGGMVTTGTALVLPFDEGDGTTTQTQTTTTTTTSTTSTTDPKAERQAQLQEKRTRRKSKQNTQQDRRQLHRTELNDRREAHQGPKVDFEVLNADNSFDAELVRVTNRDDVGAYVTNLEPMRFASISAMLDGYVYISAGTSHIFRSGRTALIPEPSNVTTWTSEEICKDDSLDGFIFSVSFSSTGSAREYRLMCDGTLRSGDNHRKNKQSQGDKSKRRKHQKSRGKGK